MICPHSGQVHLSFSLLMKCLMPNFLMISRFSIILMAYLVLYRLSKWFSLAQGKLSQWQQYLTSVLAVFSQFLIWHAMQALDLWLSLPPQPRHPFLSLIYARQSRQFIPQGAIRDGRIAFLFANVVVVMSVLEGPYDDVKHSLFSPDNGPFGPYSCGSGLALNRKHPDGSCPTRHDEWNYLPFRL
jgi:hypothetical protein